MTVAYRNAKATEYDRSGIVSVRAGAWAQVSFVDTTMKWLPVHLHGHTFAVGDGGLRKDTAIVLSGQTVTADFGAANTGAVVGALPQRQPRRRGMNDAARLPEVAEQRTVGRSSLGAGGSGGVSVGECDGQRQDGEPGQADEQRPGFVEVGGEGSVEQDAGSAVAGQQPRQGGGLGVEHRALHDADVKQRPEKCDEHATDPAEDGREQGADEGIGEGDQDVGGGVGRPAHSVEDQGGGREGHRGGAERRCGEDAEAGGE